MFDSLTRSWRFATTSYGILWHNKTLLVLPVIATLAAAAVAASFLAPLYFTGAFAEWGSLAQKGEALSIAQKVTIGVLVFLFYYCMFFVIIFFNSALVAGALKAIAGEPIGVTEMLTIAGSRLPQIAGWAAVSAIVGVVLKSIENSNEKAGMFVSSLLGTGWTVMTFFVVPTIVVDGLGPFGALKKSLEVLKQQWGQALVGNMSIGLLGFLLLLPVYLLAFGLGAAAVYSTSWTVAVPCIVGAALLAVLAISVSCAAEMVFRALLFNFATGQTLPSDIVAEELKLAFKAK